MATARPGKPTIAREETAAMPKMNRIRAGRSSGRTGSRPRSARRCRGRRQAPARSQGWRREFQVRQHGGDVDADPLQATRHQENDRQHHPERARLHRLAHRQPGLCLGLFALGEDFRLPRGHSDAEDRKRQADDQGQQRQAQISALPTEVFDQQYAAGPLIAPPSGTPEDERPRAKPRDLSIGPENQPERTRT